MYYFSLPFIYLLSILPFRVLYLLSDILSFILFDIFNYRKEVIRTNLENSFPDKSKGEIDEIEKKFHKYFCDLSLETLKTLTISKEQVKKRLSLKNTDVFEKYKDQSIIIVMGHYGNWELAGARFAVENMQQLIVIYHPLKNENFNKLVVKMRTRLGNKLYARKDTLRSMLRDRDHITATAFIADQTPAPESAYWMKFLNQDTPIFNGTEKIARKFNYPVIYVSVNRPKRGYYEITAKELFSKPSESEINEISIAHTRQLEQDILNDPVIWLWSHRRWKHKKIR